VSTVIDQVGYLIESHGMSIPQAAETMQMTVENLETALVGRRMFTTLNLALLAKETGTTMEWMLTGKDDPIPQLKEARI